MSNTTTQTTLTAEQAAKAQLVGRAIARDAGGGEWPGLGLYDGDELMAAGLDNTTQSWDEAEAVARAAYEAEQAADGDRSGTIHVFGGDLGETQFCRVDSRGSFDGGPEIDDQDDIEAAIRSGATSGKTDAGHTWYYSDRR